MVKFRDLMEIKYNMPKYCYINNYSETFVILQSHCGKQKQVFIRFIEIY